MKRSGPPSRLVCLRTRKLGGIGTGFYKISLVRLKGKPLSDYFKMKDVVTSWDEWRVFVS